MSPDLTMQAESANSLLVNVSKYGAASLIAIYLAWQLATNLPDTTAKVESMSLKIDQLQVGQSEIKQKITDSLQASNEKNDSIIHLLRGVCLNASNTNAEKQLCNP